MKEVVGDLWKYPIDIKVITTNGSVTRLGKAVMGRGCAKEAKIKFPDIDIILGTHLLHYGNHCFFLQNFNIITFPVKHNWWEIADYVLIERSAYELLKIVNSYNIESVIMPRPGSGNGKLNWSLVKQIIKPILDDRFIVITK